MEQGYSLYSVDASAKMLDVLKRKDVAHKIKIFHCKVQELELDQKFDAVLCVFSLFCYLTKFLDLRAAIKSIAGHTSSTGYALIDIPSIYAFTGLNYQSGTLIRQVDVTDLGSENGLFEYSEKISVFDDGRELIYDDTFLIKYWAPEIILAEFEAAGMRVCEDVSVRCPQFPRHLPCSFSAV